MVKALDERLADGRITISTISDVRKIVDILESGLAIRDFEAYRLDLVRVKAMAEEAAKLAGRALQPASKAVVTMAPAVPPLPEAKR